MKVSSVSEWLPVADEPGILTIGPVSGLNLPLENPGGIESKYPFAKGAASNTAFIFSGAVIAQGSE